MGIKLQHRCQSILERIRNLKIKFLSAVSRGFWVAGFWSLKEKGCLNFFQVIVVWFVREDDLLAQIEYWSSVWRGDLRVYVILLFYQESVMLSRPRQTLTQSSLKNGTVLDHLLVSQQKICLAWGKFEIHFAPMILLVLVHNCKKELIIQKVCSFFKKKRTQCNYRPLNLFKWLILV